MGIADRLRQWEARADAWSRRHLSAEEFREADALDRALRDNYLKLATLYVAATILLAFLLLGISTSLTVGKAFLVANVVLLALAAALGSIWLGYRRYAGRPLWRTVLLIVACATAGAVLVRLVDGRPFDAASVPEIVRLASTGMLAGLVMGAFVVGTTWIRGREAAAREAALRAEAERERLAKGIAEAELKLLQAQVEPHFLFNTLANLRYLVQTGAGEALPMLDHLIDYLRTALPEIRASGSTLGREAALARAYLEILRIRMAGGLAFAVDVPAGLESHPFPPLMLMTLVENAMKHGVAPVGRGRIEVSAGREDGRVRVVVQDDGRGLPAVPGTGTGLANLRERLAVLHGGVARLVLQPREGGGTVAAIEIPEAP